MKFDFITEKTGEFPIAWMCRRLGVSSSGYYTYKNSSQSAHAQKDNQLSLRIREIYKQNHGLYGSPRIHQSLRSSKYPNQSFKVGRKRVARLMRELGLSANRPKKYVRTTDSEHSLPIAPNLLNRQFTVDAPNKVWVTDITYVKTWAGWTYLAVIIDLFSRRVVGWSSAQHMKTELCAEALNAAVATRKPPKGLIHHSDRGSQYASHDYQKLLKSNGMICSMSRKGNCWDNAVSESFFGTLKQELIYRRGWQNSAILKVALDNYINKFYNCNRIHSFIGNVSPLDYEMSTGLKRVA